MCENYQNVVGANVFRRVCVVSKSACYLRLVRPSLFPYVSTRFSLDESSLNFILKNFYDACQNKFQIWMKSDKNVDDFTWRSKCAYIFDSDLKLLYNRSLRALWYHFFSPEINQAWCYVDCSFSSSAEVNNIVHFCFSMATMVTRTCQNIGLYISCLSS